MQRYMMRHLLVMVALIVIIGIEGETLRLNVWANDNTPVVLNQSLNPLLPHARFMQAASRSQALNLSIGLQVQNAGKLDVLLQNIADPQSSQFGHYISSEQFKQFFAPSDAQVQQVTSFLRSNGCSISTISRNNLLIDATCNVSQAQQAFNAHINIYKNGNDTLLANSSSLEIPARLKNLISSVNGLDSSEKVRPLYRQRRQVSKESSPIGYSPAALARAYNFAPLQDAGYLGDNQTVAFLELDGFKQADVATYYQSYNLNTLKNIDGTTQAAPDVTTIKVKNAKGLPGDGAIEPTMDLEILLGLVPHAHVLVYVGDNIGMQNFNDVLNQIVTDNKARVVSISWEVACEAGAIPGREWQVVDNLLKQGVAEGMSFFVASGDAGAYDCLDTNLQVGVPASDPYVTSVGGTTLALNTDSTYKSETGWSDAADSLHGEMGIGSGGGISSYWAMPGWQRGPGVVNSVFSSPKPCASNGKYCREIPDVAANADDGDSNPAYGDASYCTVHTSSGWQLVGGTSAAAPLWAAAAVMINHYLRNQGKPSLSLSNPTLYTLFNTQQSYAPFHDITSGTTNPPSAFSGYSFLNPKVDKSKLTNYSAGSGYDLVTGIGSPDVYNIARDMAHLVGSGVA